MSGTEEFSLAYLTLFGSSPEEMVDIAAATGYDFVSLRLTKVTAEEPLPPILDDPGLAKEIRRRAEDLGIAVLDVELARLGPEDDPAILMPLVERTADLGARFLLAQLPDPNVERKIGNFARICEMADPFGIQVGLEFPSWTATGELGSASEVVLGAAAPNGAIVVDTLHFARSASTIEQLTELPPELFPFVQLCDAPRTTPRSVQGQIHTARSARLFPGEGGLDLHPIVDALPRVPYALEIPNDMMRNDVGPEEFARRALNATRRFFARSEITHIP